MATAAANRSLTGAFAFSAAALRATWRVLELLLAPSLRPGRARSSRLAAIARRAKATRLGCGGNCGLAGADALDHERALRQGTRAEQR
jgi:hypothetical protein